MSSILENPDNARLWQRIHDFVIDDRQHQGTFLSSLSNDTEWDEDFCERLLVEYKKFMFLRRVFTEQELTPSVYVDTIWHLHLLYSINYQAFCTQALGIEFMHHDPSPGDAEAKERERISYVTTLDLYAETFGEEPVIEIWGQRPKVTRAKIDRLRRVF